jgi:6,7-dimethyl-8-ribityllumazine synthase
MTQSTNVKTRETSPRGGARFAFVKANWHGTIVDKALDGFNAEMERLGYQASAIDVFDVPGAFEIPLHAQPLSAPR